MECTSKIQYQVHPVYGGFLKGRPLEQGGAKVSLKIGKDQSYIMVG